MHTKQKHLWIGFFLILTALLLCGCTAQNTEFQNISQLNDSSISVAMWSGDPMEYTRSLHFPKAKPVVAVNSIAMNLANLRGKKVDAFLVSRVFYDSCPDKSDLCILGEELENSEYAFFFAQNEKGKKLRDEMNEFIVKANESGLQAELERLWLGETVIGRPIGTGSDDPDAPEVLFAVEYQTPPFGYIENNTCVGFDVDYAECFCKEYGYRMKTIGLPYSMIAAGDISAEYDFAGGALMTSEELASTKIVSDPHYHSPFVVIVRNSESGSGTFFSLKDRLKKTFFTDSRWQMYLNGLFSTLLIFMVSAVAGTLLGFGIYLITMDAGKVPKKIVGMIFTVLHITPTVVLLMIFYHIIFSGIRINGALVSIIVFILLMSGTVYNLMVSSVNTVGPGQTEAAIALGCTSSQAFFRIILPQALRYCIPLYKVELIGLIKITSIVGYIAVQDLTKVSDIIQTRTFDAFTPLFSSAVIYILLALFLIWLTNLVFRKTDPKNRSREKILTGLNDERRA